MIIEGLHERNTNTSMPSLEYVFIMLHAIEMRPSKRHFFLGNWTGLSCTVDCRGVWSGVDVEVLKRAEISLENDGGGFY